MDRRVPEVRFKGFTDDWEQHELEEVTTERNERSGKGELLSVTIKNGVNKTSTMDRKDNSSSDKSNYKVVYKNDIAYNSMRMWQGASGISQYNGIVSPAYTVVFPTPNLVNGHFLSYILKLHSMTWLFRTHSQGLTSDTWNLKYPLFSKISINFPKLNEQDKIYNILKIVDNIIDLQQDQLDLYKKLKLCLLQKVFPTRDEKIPKINFPNFNNNWNRFEFKDITAERNERSGKGELLSVTIKGGVDRTSALDRKDNSSSNKSNYKVVYKNDIAYNSMRMWQGASGVSKYNGIVSPAYTVIIPTSTLIRSDFLSYLIKLNSVMWLFRTHSQGLTSDTWNLKYPLFSKISIRIPELNEQDKITSILKIIDKVIFDQNKKMQNLTSLKIFLLQNLFV